MRSRPERSRLLALVGSVALLASACASTASGESSTELSDGPDAADWVAAYDIDPWEDGLTRAVVRWDPDAEPTATDDGPRALRAGLDDVDGPADLDGLDDLDGFDPVDPDHPLAGTPRIEPAPAPDVTIAPTTTTTTTTVPPADAVVELGAADEAHELLANDGVVEVVPLGDGLYQVAADLPVEEILDLPGVQEGWPELVAGINDDPRQPEQWYLDNDGSAVRGQPGVAGADIAAPPVWDRSTGAGVIVAVIDTGVDVTHPDLVDNLWTNPGEVCGNGVDDDGNGYTDDCQGWDFAQGDASMADTNGHGTHIAGTIAAVTDNGQGVAGVAPAARIMPVRISTGPSFGLAVTVPAIDYAVANGADVLNLSWGTRPGTPVGAYPPLEAAIERARQAGVVVMIAAGNDGTNIDSATVIPASYPHDNVVTVGASTNADQRASFSNHGARSVEVFAPGHHIMATLPGGGYGYQSGTSMATPVAAGVAALLVSAAPSAAPVEIRQALVDGSTPVGALAPFSASDGRIDAPGALTQLAPGVSFEVAGALGLEPDAPATLAITSAVDPSSGLSAAGAGVRATLLVEYGGGIRTVIDQDVVVDGVATLTDADGRVTGTQRGGPPGMQLEAALPAGRYGLLLELVDGGGNRVGEAGLMGFDVVPPAAPTPTTTTPPSSGGGGGPATSPPATTVPASPGTGTPAPSDGGAPPVTTIPTVPGGGSPAPTTTSPSSGGGGGGGSTPAPTTPPPNGGGGGGSTPAPTTPPSNGGGGGGSTPAPTTPPSNGGGGGGSTPAPTTPPSGGSPGPISVGDISITAISPDVGTVAGGDLITITGTDLGERPTVLFGDRAATVLVNVVGVQLLVLSPSSPAGTVDVSVVDGSRRGTVPGGFTFVEPGSGAPSAPSAPTTTVPSAAGSPPPSGGTGPGVTPAPGGGTAPGTPPPSDTAAPPSTTEPAVVEGPGGLRLGRPSADLEALSLVAGDLGRAGCTTDPCLARPRS